MLAACAPLARWIDVFCDRGAFDVDETRVILTAGIAAGLQAAVHAGQLGPSGGIRLAVELGAASVDHCTYASDDDIEALAGELHGRHAAAGGRVLHAGAMAGRPPDDRRRRHRRARDRLQPGQFVHHEHAVLHRRGGQGHEVHAGAGAVVGDGRWCRRAPARRRRGRWRRAGGPTSSASTRPPTSIWRTGRGFRSCGMSLSAASRDSVR